MKLLAIMFLALNAKLLNLKNSEQHDMNRWTLIFAPDTEHRE